MLLKSSREFAPGPVELYRLLEAATRLVRMHANELLPGQRVRLFHDLQVIDVSQPERTVLTPASDVKHLPRHTQSFQQPDDGAGVTGGFGVLATNKFKGC